MNHLNQRHNNEKQKWEKSHESLLKSIEKRYNEQNEQLKHDNIRLSNELKEREI